MTTPRPATPAPPTTIKRPLFDWPTDKPAHEAIGEAIGAASMCWIPLPSTAVFDSVLAAQIADELEDLLRRKLWVEDD